MLRTDLIDLINSGRAWAFVGSGVSSDAGCPSWGGLVEIVASSFDPEITGSIRTDSIFASAYKKDDFAECFDRIERIGGRLGMDTAVRERLCQVKQPRQLSKLLADWPFAGYITTNYDALLEAALQEIKQLGWSSVGNTRDEARKLSGEPTRVVWHVHGAVDLPDEKSHLILTSRDYDEHYLEESPMVQQLRALLMQRRAVFVGFGFQDQEVMRLLKLVGRLSNPAQPAFAFLHGLSGMENRDQRLQLLEKYNVDVIPYRVQDGSHRQLVDLLDTYESLVLRRTQRFGRPIRPCPSYDPETTGLLLYNNLALRGEIRISEDVLGSLLKARILSLIQYRGAITVESIIEDVRERVAVINTQAGASPDTAVHVGRCLHELAQLGDIGIEGSGKAQSVYLTSKGVETAEAQAGTAQRIADQFSASIAVRVHQRSNADQTSAMRIAQCAESYLKECVSRRALGVAMVWNSLQPDYRSYHMVALLQSLPGFMAQLAGTDEAKVLVGVVTDILASPSDAETTYLGLLLQAQFGVHLLGYDSDTLRVRARELASTFFLIDSTTLIPFLARSSSGHRAARLLITKLLDMGAQVGTTTMLADEAIQHARWPIDAKVVLETGQCTLETAKAAKGRAGYRSNAFLEGFLQEAESGKSLMNYLAFLRSICECRLQSLAELGEALEGVLPQAGVRVFRFDEWPGFTPELWARQEEVADQIAQLRIASNTYTHERQVKAEAEALIIIGRLRERALGLEEQTLTDAYFISRTRVIDTVSGITDRITMQPEAVLQWLATLSPCPAEELGF